MTAFDTKISVMGASLATTSEEAVKNGELPNVELAITAGLITPFGNPATGEPVVLPHGTYRFSFDKKTAIDLFTAAVEAAENLPEGPVHSGKIQVASNLSEVEAAARRLEQATKKGR